MLFSIRHNRTIVLPHLEENHDYLPMYMSRLLSILESSWANTITIFLFPHPLSWQNSCLCLKQLQRAGKGGNPQVNLLFIMLPCWKKTKTCSCCISVCPVAFKEPELCQKKVETLVLNIILNNCRLSQSI